MTVTYFVHVPYEFPAAIDAWAQQYNHTAHYCKWYESPAEELPADTDMLVVMGGPMSIFDYADYPWLATERLLIRQAIEQQKIVIGVCLGAQLIADVLGAKVYAGEHKEIGWFDVMKTVEASFLSLFDHIPRRLPVFHWHGDTFDIPDGAVSIFESEATPSQGFVYGDKVLALQFHFESTADSIAVLAQHHNDELLAGGKYVQPVADITKHLGVCGTNNQYLFTLLDEMLLM